MELPKGLCIVGSTELEKVIRDWESPKISEDETTLLKDLAKKLFSTFDNDNFDFGHYSVVRRKYKHELTVVSVILGLIVGLVAGVSLAALFNWIF